MEFTFPNGFEEKIRNIIGDEWEDFKVSYENNKFQSLRINRLKVKESDIDTILDTVGASKDKVPWEENGRYYDMDSHPGKHPYHEMGIYYIQEPSAMSAAALLAPENGMRVLDLCAAPGGKSTQLANYLGNTGLLVSNEINATRCKILSSNIERLGVRNALVTNEDSFKLAEHFGTYFHEILVDAPCSGEGMFRKNPEAVNEWSKEQVIVCANRQREILDNASRMLLPGGCIVYSTCTFSKEENEDVIIDFLNNHDDYSLEERNAPWFDKAYINENGAYRLWPHKLNGEGHFVAVLRKAGKLNMDDEQPVSKKKNKSKLGKDKLTLVQDFIKDTLVEDKADWFDEERLELFGEQLYLLPKQCPRIAGIRVLRAGLHLGEFKKNRFEPSHALALALKKEECKKNFEIALDDERVFSYLSGEGIFLNENDTISFNKGWCLITVDGYSAGWGKIAGSQIKNHYPKGLRKDLK